MPLSSNTVVPNKKLPLYVDIEHLYYSVPNHKNPILQNVHCSVHPGELLAIMGPSGSGKTTLLNILAGRNEHPISRGHVLINGLERNKKMKRLIGYVLQDDVLFDNLTVRETLTYAAKLKLPDTMTLAEKLQRVEEIISILGLEKCANTIVGSALQRGISGGERRRLNIGTQMITYPSLLLLDEPTSGLDSSLAAELLRTLKNLAAGGRTVITTIHQPSSLMYEMFDRLLVLSDGEIVYGGPANLAVSYFASLNHPCKPHYNPADFLLELCTDRRARDYLVQQYRERVSKETHLDTWEIKEDDFTVPAKTPSESSHHSRDSHDSPHPASAHDLALVQLAPSSASSSFFTGGSSEAAHPGGARDSIADGASSSSASSKPLLINKPTLLRLTSQHDLEQRKRLFLNELEAETQWPTGFWTQFTVLAHRSFKQKKGMRLKPLAWVQTAAMALIVSALWFQMAKTEEAIQDRYALLFFFVVYWGFQSMLGAQATFVSERAVVSKERAAGTYRMLPYFLAKNISELPLNVVLPACMITICYFVAGLPNNAGTFFAFLFTCLFSIETAYSCGLAISTFFMNFEKSMTTATILMLGAMLAAGFYVKLDNIPDGVIFLPYLSFVQYGFSAICNIIFTADEFFTCAEVSKYESCPARLINGHDVLRVNAMDVDNWGHDFGGLVALFVGYRVLAYLFLRFLHVPKMAKA